MLSILWYFPFHLVKSKFYYQLNLLFVFVSLTTNTFKTFWKVHTLLWLVVASMMIIDTFVFWWTFHIMPWKWWENSIWILSIWCIPTCCICYRCISCKIKEKIPKFIISLMENYTKMLLFNGTRNKLIFIIFSLASLYKAVKLH